MFKSTKEKALKLLRWSEKYTQTDMLYLTKGGFWLGSMQLISSMSAFLLAVVFANLLPKEIYGDYKYILSIASILGISTLYGINSSITQSVARNIEGSFKESLKTKIKWGLIGAIIALGFSGYYLFRHNYTFSVCFTIMAIFLPFYDSFGIYSAFLNGRKSFKRLSKFGIIELIIETIIAIGIAALYKNLMILVLSFFATRTIIKLFFYLRTVKKEVPNQNTDVETIRYGKHLSLISVIGEIARYLDEIIVFQFIGPIALATYSLATAPAGQINGVLSQTKNLIIPKYVQADSEKIKSGMIKKMVQFGAIILAITLIYILIAPIAFKLIFPKYVESVFYSQVFAFTNISLIALIPSAFLQAKKEIKKLYTLNFINPILNITIMLIAVQFGIMGMIIGRIFSSIVHTIYITYLAKKS